MKEFTREELQEIRDRAVNCAINVPENQWTRTHRQLADAADRLDAMEARAEDKT